MIEMSRSKVVEKHAFGQTSQKFERFSKWPPKVENGSDAMSENEIFEIRLKYWLYVYQMKGLEEENTFLKEKNTFYHPQTSMSPLNVIRKRFLLAKCDHQNWSLILGLCIPNERS